MTQGRQEYMLQECAKASPGLLAKMPVAPVTKALDGLRSALPTYGRWKPEDPQKPFGPFTTHGRVSYVPFTDN